MALGTHSTVRFTTTLAIGFIMAGMANYTCMPYFRPSTSSSLLPRTGTCGTPGRSWPRTRTGRPRPLSTRGGSGSGWGSGSIRYIWQNWQFWIWRHRPLVLVALNLSAAVVAAEYPIPGARVLTTFVPYGHPLPPPKINIQNPLPTTQYHGNSKSIETSLLWEHFHENHGS